MDAPLDILYEEGPVLAINKPAGLLTQAPLGIDSLEAQVKRFLITRDSKPGGCYLGLPHRIDRPASGVILFAKHVRAAHRLSEQFQSRLIGKKYWAILSGDVADETGTWIDYMRKIPGEAASELLEPIHPDAREAILHYRVLARCTGPNTGPISWLEIGLETGRTHQIRLQCGSRGFPILGDRQYGSTLPFGEPFDDERLRGIALHSREITFSHPQTGQSVTLTAPVSPPWHPFLSPHGEPVEKT